MKKSANDDASDWRPAEVPDTSSLSVMKQAAKSCTACHLYKRATQTVFGEGSKGATLLLLGEQPGDQEDLAGKPFVGPAGKLLDRALEEAGIDRREVYVTNTVKHFKWELRGKRRIHQSLIRAKSRRADRGSRRNYDSLGRNYSCVSARSQRNRFSGPPFALLESGKVLEP